MNWRSCASNRGEAKGEATVERPSLSQEDIFTARKEVLNIHMADAIEQYIVRLVMATRQPSDYDSELAKWLSMGVSPRATIALDRCARAHAWLAGRDFVSPEDVQAMAYPVCYATVFYLATTLKQKALQRIRLSTNFLAL